MTEQQQQKQQEFAVGDHVFRWRSWGGLPFAYQQHGIVVETNPADGSMEILNFDYEEEEEAKDGSTVATTEPAETDGEDSIVPEESLPAPADHENEEKKEEETPGPAEEKVPKTEPNPLLQSSAEQISERDHAKDSTTTSIGEDNREQPPENPFQKAFADWTNKPKNKKEAKEVTGTTKGETEQPQKVSENPIQGAWRNLFQKEPVAQEGSGSTAANSEAPPEKSTDTETDGEDSTLPDHGHKNEKKKEEETQGTTEEKVSTTEPALGGKESVIHENPLLQSSAGQSSEDDQAKDRTISSVGEDNKEQQHPPENPFQKAIADWANKLKSNKDTEEVITTKGETEQPEKCPENPIQGAWRNLFQKKEPVQEENDSTTEKKPQGANSEVPQEKSTEDLQESKENPLQKALANWMARNNNQKTDSTVEDAVDETTKENPLQKAFANWIHHNNNKGTDPEADGASTLEDPKEKNQNGFAGFWQKRNQEWVGAGRDSEEDPQKSMQRSESVLSALFNSVPDDRPCAITRQSISKEDAQEQWEHVEYGSEWHKRLVSRAGCCSPLQPHPIPVVLLRIRFLQEHQEELLGSIHYHHQKANGECVAAWCKAGQYASLQGTAKMGQPGLHVASFGMAAEYAGVWGGQIVAGILFPPSIPFMAAYDIAEAVHYGHAFHQAHHVAKGWEERTKAWNEKFSKYVAKNEDIVQQVQEALLTNDQKGIESSHLPCQALKAEGDILERGEQKATLGDNETT